MTLNSLLDKIELEKVKKALHSKGKEKEKAVKDLKDWREKFGTGYWII